MIFPISSESPLQKTPVVTLSLIGLYTIIWLITWLSDPELILLNGGLIPAHFWQHSPKSTHTLLLYSTLITSGFLHGGFFHLLGNSLFLYAFGCKLEDRLGPSRYLLFYFLVQLLTNAVYVLYYASLTRPTIGASGVISGVMGAYLLKFPHTHIRTFFWVLVRVWLLRIPAFILLGYWLLINIFQSWTSQSATTRVAWGAHLLGFGFGILVIGLMLGFHIESTAKDEKTHTWKETLSSALNILKEELLTILLAPLTLFAMAFITTFFVAKPWWIPSLTLSLRLRFAIAILFNQLPIFLMLGALIIGTLWWFRRQRTLQHAIAADPCLLCKKPIHRDEDTDLYLCQHCGFHSNNRHNPLLKIPIQLLQDIRIAEHFLEETQDLLRKSITQSSLISFDEERNKEILQSFEESLSIFRDLLHRKNQPIQDTLNLPSDEHPTTTFNTKDLPKLSRMSPDYSNSGNTKADIDTHREQLRILQVALAFLSDLSNRLKIPLLTEHNPTQNTQENNQSIP